MKFLTVDFPLYEAWNLEIQFRDNTLEVLFNDPDGAGRIVEFKSCVAWKWTHYPLCGEVEGLLAVIPDSDWPREHLSKLGETMSTREAEQMLKNNPLRHYRLNLEELGSLEALAASVKAR
jgi:hypothetical protein